MAASRIAAARPWQSYIVTVDPLVLNVTLRHVLATTFMAVWLPVRVSPGSPPPWVSSTITQRRRPAATFMAIQDALTDSDAVVSDSHNPWERVWRLVHSGERGEPRGVRVSSRDGG